MRLSLALIVLHLFILAACAIPPGQPLAEAALQNTIVTPMPSATAILLSGPTITPVPTTSPARIEQSAPVSSDVGAEPAASLVNDVGAVLSPTVSIVIPNAVPTPTARPAGTPPRVGLQIGHLRSHELPEELAHLRSSTGAHWNGITEARVNEAIAVRVRDILIAAGVEVDLLPATVPPSYDADAFVAIHADGSVEGARGWKIATPWRASAASKMLMEAVAKTYGTISGLPEDRNGVTINMRGYYAFNYRRHTHAIAATTPAIIVETGFLTNADDRAIIVARPELAARGIAEGILKYLNQRDPEDGTALLPPEWPILYTSVETTIRTGPADTARAVARVPANSRIFVFNQNDDWYEALVRVGDQRYIGWVQSAQTRLATLNDVPLRQFVEPSTTNP